MHPKFLKHNDRSMKLLISRIMVTVSTIWYTAPLLAVPVFFITSSAQAAPLQSPQLSTLSPAIIPSTPLNQALIDDLLIIEAYNAFKAKNISILQTLMTRSTDHPLRDYIGYWYWQKVLETSELTTELHDQIKSWTQLYSGTVLSNLLRQQWLKKQLANVTPHFLTEFDRLEKPSNELMCASWLLRGRPEADRAKEFTLWGSPKELPPACEQWLSWRAQQGEMDRYRYRLYLASTQWNARGLARMAMVISPPDDLNILYKDPEQWLTQRTELDSPWDVVALLVALKNKKIESGEIDTVLRRFKGVLHEEASTYVGYLFAKRLAPEAPHYFTQGILSPQLPGVVLSWRLRTFLRFSNWPEVLKTTQIAPKGLKEEDSAWSYWQSRALLELNQVDEANSILKPLANEPHYYGVLAKEALGQMWIAPETSPIPPQHIQSIMTNPGIQRALTLARLNWRDEAYQEWKWALRKASDEELNAAAYIASQSQYYDWAINTAVGTQQSHNFNMRFLTPYQDVAVQAEQAFQVPSAWVLGVIRQESRFDANARSWVGALGLMQLMPATAKEIAQKTGLPGRARSALLDPGVNIPMGTYYLSELLQRLGSPVKVTAAYNAGASRARAWQTDRNLEGAVYVESIPFDETRKYVKRVMENWYFYHRVLGNKAALTLTSLLGTIPPSGMKGTWSSENVFSTAPQ